MRTQLKYNLDLLVVLKVVKGQTTAPCCMVTFDSFIFINKFDIKNKKTNL